MFMLTTRTAGAERVPEGAACPSPSNYPSAHFRHLRPNRDSISRVSALDLIVDPVEEVAHEFRVGHTVRH
jgi:hypothetical protein